jgi:phospholipid/cholesterol/gamma-HCH transport system substrate-binding protein
VRRIGLILATAAAAAVVLLAAGPAKESDAGDAIRVDALFHSAAGVVSGQNVKVAGVPAGTVKSVELTEDRLALVEMEVQTPFAPFRADARCEVRPQSLIGERFVQCDPGTPEAGELEPPEGGETPTVPAAQTTAPIDLDLVFDVLRQPYRERLAIILNELGAGLSGRGEDLNALIRNANPALADARDLLGTLNRQRTEIRAAIADTDRLLAQVAERPGSLRRFLRSAAEVSEEVGTNADDLSATVEELPALLGEAEPALRELDALSVEALPVVRNLRLAAPDTRRLFTQLRPLSKAARPTLNQLGETTATGRVALQKSAPFADSLRRTLGGLRPITPTARELLRSLTANGGTEGLLRFFYNAALATSRFDSTSHIFPAHMIGGLCGLYRSAGDPIEGCHGKFGGAVSGNAAKALAKRFEGQTPAAPTPGAPGAPSTPGAPGEKPDAPADVPGLPPLKPPPPIQVPGLPPLLPGGGGAGGNGSGGGNAISNILDLLLGP